MGILAASGDIGGARAVIKVLERMHDKGVEFKVLRHRGLEDVSEHWKSVPFDDTNQAGEILRDNGVTALLFSSSVKDDVPLRFAAKAKDIGIPVVFLLDNWMNYRSRLELDGSLILPDRYLVMDELAYQGALAEDLPEDILEIVGQPVLAELKKDYQSFHEGVKKLRRQALGIVPDKKLLVFVSEPAESDQGADASNPDFRGYTEKTVLAELCRQLQPFCNDFQIALLPHPREDRDGLVRVWKENAGGLSGGLFGFESSREALFLAEGVCGMASLLLQEAWLLNKPVISIQPGVIKEDLTKLNQRQGLICLTDNSQWGTLLDLWLKQTSDRAVRQTREELDSHLGAADRIVEIILELCA